MKPLFLVVLLIPVFCRAQSIPGNTDELLTAYSNQHKFSGNVLIAKEGKIVFEKSYGYADIAHKKLNTPGTEFRIGSLTKMFTSTLILQLADEKKISLNDPVSKYVPHFPYKDAVTIINLLSHTSGIKGVTPPPEPANLAASVDRFKYDSLAFTPGSKFEYNNFNYILLGYIAQKITGTPYEKLVTERVLRKANMLHSGIDKKNRISENKAIGYTTNPADGQWIQFDQGDVALASGAGGMYSTARDLYNWSLAIDKHLVLSDSLTKLAMTPLLNNYGLGWMTTDVFGRKQTGHTGSIPGFIANFMKYKDENITVVLLSNYQDVDGRKLSEALAAVSLGEKYNLPVVKKAVTLSPDELKKFVGEYRMPNGFSITVSTEDRKLFALAQGDPEKVELTPEGQNKFFLKGPETAIEFIDENGTVKYMFVDIQGGQKLTRVTGSSH